LRIRNRDGQHLGQSARVDGVVARPRSLHESTGPAPCPFCGRVDELIRRPFDATRWVCDRPSCIYLRALAAARQRAAALKPPVGTP